jgi:hypothetical protein
MSGQPVLQDLFQFRKFYIQFLGIGDKLRSDCLAIEIVTSFPGHILRLQIILPGGICNRLSISNMASY